MTHFQDNCQEQYRTLHLGKGYEVEEVRCMEMWCIVLYSELSLLEQLADFLCFVFHAATWMGCLCCYVCGYEASALILHPASQSTLITVTGSLQELTCESSESIACLWTPAAMTLEERKKVCCSAHANCFIGAWLQATASPLVVTIVRVVAPATRNPACPELHFSFLCENVQFRDLQSLWQSGREGEFGAGPWTLTKGFVFNNVSCYSNMAADKENCKLSHPATLNASDSKVKGNK